MADNSLSPTIGGSNVPSYQPAAKISDRNVIIPGNVYRTKGRRAADRDDGMLATWRVYDRDSFRVAAAEHIKYHGIAKILSNGKDLIDEIFDTYGRNRLDNIYFALPTELLSSWAFMVYDQYGVSVTCGGGSNPASLYNLITGPEF